jgi:cysteine desulfurase
MIKQIRSERRALGNNTPLYLHTDACQAGNYLDLHVHRLGVDLMTLNGGKMYGPKQSGILYKAAHAQLEPIIFGGGQEFELRSGTENVASIIGFATALGMAQSAKTKEVKRLQELQEQFINGLQGLQGWALQASECVINGSLKHRLPNNVHVTFLDQDNERLMMALDERGIMAATGSACSASKEEASHVLTALGLTETEARSSLRFTMGRQTTLEDIKYTVAMLQSVATTL